MSSWRERSSSGPSLLGRFLNILRVAILPYSSYRKSLSYTIFLSESGHPLMKKDPIDKFSLVFKVSLRGWSSPYQNNLLYYTSILFNTSHRILHLNFYSSSSVFSTYYAWLFAGEMCIKGNVLREGLMYCKRVVALLSCMFCFSPTLFQFQSCVSWSWRRSLFGSSLSM